MKYSPRAMLLQALLSSASLRVNTSSDVVRVHMFTFEMLQSPPMKVNMPPENSEFFTKATLQKEN